MSDDLLSKLMAASNDEERDWLVMQFSLDNLAPETRDAVWAAAIPHWFDLDFLAAMLDKPGSESIPIFEQLLALSFVEPFQDRGYNIHERSRSLLLNQLWQSDQPRYRQFAQRAANYCSNQDLSSTDWRIEHIYHLLIATPDRGVDEFVNTGWDWHNSPNFAYAKVEAMILVVRELADADRLSARGLAWTQFWEGLLDYDYSRYRSAKNKLVHIKITSAEDVLLAGTISQRLGGLLVHLGELDEARRQYEAAIHLSQQIDDRLGEANCIQGLGDIHLRLGEYGQARRQYEAAMRLFQQIVDRLGEANCIKGLGDIYLCLREHDQARRQYEAAIPLYKEVGAKNHEGVCHAGMAACYRKLGMMNEYHQHVALARELMTRQSGYNLACLASVCGDVDEALTLLRSALEKREVYTAWARKDPDFEWIHDDPRFAQLLDEMAAQQD